MWQPTLLSFVSLSLFYFLSLLPDPPNSHDNVIFLAGTEGDRDPGAEGFFSLEKHCPTKRRNTSWSLLMFENPIQCHGMAGMTAKLADNIERERVNLLNFLFTHNSEMKDMIRF